MSPPQPRPALVPLCAGAAVAIVAVGAVLPSLAGVAVLACIPVLASARSEARRDVWLVGGLAAAATLLLAASGPLIAGIPVPAPLLQLPASLGVGLAIPLALALQRQRLAVASRGDAAATAGEMNRLLMSLLAHDLRSPLSLADQGFQYVEDAAAGGYPVDRALVADVRARLQRSLRAIEMVLGLAREQVDPPPANGTSELTAVCLRDEVRAELAAFAYEAESRQKQLVDELDGLGAATRWINVLALRQSLAILLDNAVRYADPGVIRVSGRSTGSTLELRVADGGPGLSAHRRRVEDSGGSGLGLRLCGALLARAGGSLSTERDGADGTTFLIRLPLSTLAPLETRPDAPALTAV